MADADTVAGATAAAPSARTDNTLAQSTPDTAPDTSAGANISPSPTTCVAAQPTLARTESAALGPATDAPMAHPTTSSPGTALNISLMLTTGARHPYKIDEKYLTSRKVSTYAEDGTFDPRLLSGYQLKELIWTDWRQEDWEVRPASPSSIRLILMGRMIEDKGVLRDFPFNVDQTNVVHMTVKPADLIEDEAEPSGKGKSGVLRARDADGEERGSCCRCVVQ